MRGQRIDLGRMPDLSPGVRIESSGEALGIDAALRRCEPVETREPMWTVEEYQLSFVAVAVFSHREA